MKALPAIDTMAGLVLAGMDHRAFVVTTDPVIRLLDVAVGERVLIEQGKQAEQRRQNLATEIGNRVGSIVARAPRNIAQALRG